MANKNVEINIKARDEASGIFGSLLGKVTAVGVAISSYFGISSFIGAIKGAAQLESKLSEVRAVSGATAAEMVLLRKAAEDAGATTKFTATEGADALGNLARAGLNAKDAIAALPAVLQLAQAGGIGLAEASEYLTKAVAGMGLQFSDSARVADVLAAGANASNTSVTGLAQALSYTAPIAKSLGLSLETTVAIIGKFADAGIDASRAGTALNAVLSQFADPASKFRQELAGAGIITGNFETALRQLAAAGPAGTKAILAVGTEAGPALRALLNQGIGALDELKGKLDAAKGSAAATAAIMEDSLSGSFNSLSSAWDTVKNTLATPVLPVLRDGVIQLSDAFTRAVNDGTVGKFGAAIATAFQSGLKWVREFLGTVDFNELSVRMSNFATRTQEVFTQIGNYATNAGNIMKTAYGVMSAGANVVMTGIYGIGIAAAEVSALVVKGALSMSEALSKIAIGSVKQQLLDQVEGMRIALGGLNAVSDEFGKRASSAFAAAADSALLAREGWAGLTTEAGNASKQATASAQVFNTVSETLKEVGGDATAAGQKAQAAGILHKEAADKARVAVAQLKVEYEAALNAGNVQLAVEKLQAMQAALRTTSDQAKLTAQDVEGAFTRLGVTSSAELAKARDNAVRDYNIIKDSGTATARDIQEAFRKMAAEAIAANNGIAPAWLQTEAAVRNVTIAVDENGKAIVQSTDKSKSSVEGLTKSYEKMGVAAETAGQKAKRAAFEKSQEAQYGRPGGSDGLYDRPSGGEGMYDRPGGNDIYGKPQAGSQLSDSALAKLPGNGANDMSFQFGLRDKLVNGTLTQADAADLAHLIKVMRGNEAIDRSATASKSFEGMRDQAYWQKIREDMEYALAKLNAPSTPTPDSQINTPAPDTKTPSGASSRSVYVNINTPQGPQRVLTDDAGAKALVRSLAAASQAAR